MTSDHKHVHTLQLKARREWVQFEYEGEIIPLEKVKNDLIEKLPQMQLRGLLLLIELSCSEDGKIGTCQISLTTCPRAEDDGEGIDTKKLAVMCIALLVKLFEARSEGIVMIGNEYMTVHDAYWGVLA